MERDEGLALPKRIWTIGHSSLTLDEFITRLEHYELQAIVDVRRFPGSRRLPHFGKDALASTLQARGITYRWLASLGGRRRARPDSPNTAWRNASFKGYADHLDTDEFREGCRALLDLAAAERTAMMCAEVLWWRCHRSLIADVLKIRGVEVTHILDMTHTVEHPFTSAAHIVNGRLSYAAQEQ